MLNGAEEAAGTGCLENPGSYQLQVALSGDFRFSSRNDPTDEISG